jgi:signal transduction histidine kinase
MESHDEITRLRDRVSELERQKAAMEDFAAVAAHELLTPVVMIDACAATVADRLDHDERHADSLQDLDVLRRGCMHSRLLVESLLHHSVLHDRPLERRSVELDALVAECLALLGPELRARGASVHVAPLPTVDAEAPLIRAVFLNLLVNALKYGPRRDATVRVGVEREPTAWRFSVHSEGTPVPAEDRDWIFEPRRRGREERRVRGGGLGLAVCRWIVERHGGEIGCRAEGEGNCFAFTLPA